MTTKKADDNFTMFHRKYPRVEILVKNAIKKKHETVGCLGRATWIVYRSDKWEKDGNHFDYEHEFDSKPKLWAPLTAVKAEQIKGRTRKAAGFFGRTNSKGCTSVAQLGTVLDLEYKDNSGEIMSVAWRGAPELLLTSDRRTLIILSNVGPIFINGGKMTVGPRGIVK